ncbi:MAG TPA: hypothetical protein ENK05_09755 [Gammaproteobacteria bacterium]|nr:hypothetical protein [Gammaproteobacteria bacterium]
MKRMVVLWLPLLLGVATARAMDVNLVAVDYRDGAYTLELDAVVEVPEARARALLTDYANLGRINPSIEESEILEDNDGEGLRVRTVTRVCVWFYCKRVTQVQDVSVGWDRSVTATLIPELSDFSFGWARLHLWQQPNGTRVLIRSELAPDFWIPPLIGHWLIKRKLRSEALETIGRMEKVGKGADAFPNTHENSKDKP